MDFDLSGLDVGDIDMGSFDDVGAVRRRMRRGGRSLRPSGVIVKATPANVQRIPGINPVAAKEMVLPLGSGFFAVAQPNANVTLTVQPQVPFKGRRLAISLTRTGTTAQTPLITLTGFSVGIKDQRAGLGAAPADLFSPLAVGVALVMDPAGPGVNISCTISASAIPTTTDRIDFAVAIIGEGIS